MAKAAHLLLLLAMTFNLFSYSSEPDSFESLSAASYPYPYYDMDRSRTIDPLLAFCPETLAELEKHSKIIVQGQLTDDAQQRSAGLSKRSIPHFQYTVSSLKISKVWKGSFRTEDTLKLCEPYYIKETQGAEQLVITSNYMPSEIGKEYLFFLNDMQLGDETVYAPTIYENGRYPLTLEQAGHQEIIRSPGVEALSNQELNLADRDASVYRSIYKEVLQKYYGR
ncbi:hypothetical protein [Clostridium minihomine]|uniref:hypothetical protein n=1 Tax=Clostridium minihomine TaxID=2045012 RepID=UPI000C775AD1|nr:hypothetical protein [Clostridium minihomine]